MLASKVFNKTAIAAAIQAMCYAMLLNRRARESNAMAHNGP